MRYRFGSVELDTAAYTVRRAGRDVSLQPKVFDVLRYLIEHRDRVVSKEELLDAVWRGEHVNESAVPWSVSHARTALGQARGRKAPIETIHGRGYRFTASVEVFGTTPASAPPPAAPGPEGTPAPRGPRPFVGRTEILKRLQARLDEALQGHGYLCLLSGEPGIGKTRCCEELTALAAQRGFSIWAGRSIEDGGEPVFWPWQQILREAVRSRPEIQEPAELLLGRLMALAPGKALSGQDAGPERDERARRFLLLDEITRLLLNAAQSAPILLLLDDLQWADEGTLSLLGFLAPELQNARILVVATMREEVSRSTQQHLGRLARHAERIELARLSVDDVGRYIEQLTGDGAPPRALVSAVHRATNGNPLFVQETVRGLISEHGQAGLNKLEPSTVKFPAVARDVLRAPLAALEPEARDALTRASVLGESFELPVLQALCDLPLGKLLDLIEAATRRGLLVAETPQRYRFSHALIRELLYDEVATAERVAWHRKAAETLEALQSAEPRYNEIAQHFYRSLPAGDYGRVVGAARRAALAAETALAYENAVGFYQWALEAQALDPSVGPRERGELLLATGRAQRHAGRPGDSRQTLTRLFEIARQHGYGDLLVRAARLLRPTFAMSSIPDPLVRGSLEEALKIAPDGPNAQRVLAMSLLACVPPYALDLQRSKQLSEDALGLARRLGERAPLFEALRARLYSLSGPDDTDALMAVAGEIIELDGERPSVMSSEALMARLGALLYRGEIGLADQALERVGGIAQTLRLPEAVWYCDRQRAQRAFMRGEFAAAEAACNELSARATRIGLLYGPMFVEMLRTRIHIERVGLKQYAASRDLSGVAADALNLDLGSRARLLRGAAELGTRTAKPAMELIAAHGFDRIPKDIAYLSILANIACAAVDLGDQERAEQLYASLAPYPHHNTTDGLLLDEGSVSRYLAMLAICLGRHERVQEHFEAAVALNRKMDRGPQLARTLLEYASWLATQPRQAAEARQRGKEAGALAESFGMHWLVAQAPPPAA